MLPKKTTREKTFIFVLSLIVVDVFIMLLFPIWCKPHVKEGIELSCGYFLLIFSYLAYRFGINSYDLIVLENSFVMKNSLQKMEIAFDGLIVYNIWDERKGDWMFQTNLFQKYVFKSRDNYAPLIQILQHTDSSRFPPEKFYNLVKDKFYVDDWYLTPPE